MIGYRIEPWDEERIELLNILNMATVDWLLSINLK